MGEEDSFSLGRQSARVEAIGLFRMLGRDGNTIETIRGLVSVPPKSERVLRAYARAHAEDAHWIQSTLKFRGRVLEEFERLVRDGIPVADLPEVEGPESGAPEEAYANAQP